MTMRTIVTWAVLASSCAAAMAGPKPARAKPKTRPGPVTVAVLDYDLTLPGNKDLGSQMADILTVRLSL